MFLTTHAAAGVLISQRLDSPLWVFVISIFVHFIMDFIPHGDDNLYQEWDPKKRKRASILASIDFLCVIILISVLYTTTDLPRIALVSAGLAGSLLPDLISNFFPFVHEKYQQKLIFRALYWLQKKTYLLHPFIKGNNYLHDNFHHFIDHFFDYRISPIAGFSIQIVIIAVFLISEFTT